MLGNINYQVEVPEGRRFARDLSCLLATADGLTLTQITKLMQSLVKLKASDILTPYGQSEATTDLQTAVTYEVLQELFGSCDMPIWLTCPQGELFDEVSYDQAEVEVLKQEMLNQIDLHSDEWRALMAFRLHHQGAEKDSIAIRMGLSLDGVSEMLVYAKTLQRFCTKNPFVFLDWLIEKKANENF